MVNFQQQLFSRFSGTAMYVQFVLSGAESALFVWHFTIQAGWAAGSPSYFGREISAPTQPTLCLHWQKFTFDDWNNHLDCVAVWLYHRIERGVTGAIILWYVAVWLYHRTEQRCILQLWLLDAQMDLQQKDSIDLAGSCQLWDILRISPMSPCEEKCWSRVEAITVVFMQLFLIAEAEWMSFQWCRAGSVCFGVGHVFWTDNVTA